VETEIFLFTQTAHCAGKRSAARSFGQLVAFTRTEYSRYSTSTGETMASNAAALTDSHGDMELRLWQAVLVTTIQEWVSGTLRSQREAEQYLFQDQNDFRTVCQSAGFDADRLRAKLNRLRPKRPASPLAVGPTSPY